MDSLDQQRALKRWFKFSKTHKTIPAPHLLNKDQLASDSTCYKYIIHHLENIAQIKQNHMAVKFLINLYYVQDAQFFGRTYESNQIDLFFQPDGKQCTFEPQCIFFHLKLSQDVKLNLVIEVVQLEKDNNEVQINRNTIGWCQIPVNGTAEGPQKVNLKKGSSRLLNSRSSDQIAFEPSQQNISFDVQFSKSFNQVKFLIPEGCICGTGDEILGTVEKQVPSGNSQNQPELTLLPETTVFIQNIMVQVPLSIENEFINSVKKYKEAKYKDPEQNLNIQITSKRLLVGFHNGWTFTNTKGMSNSVALEEGNAIQQFIDGKAVDYRKMEFHGAVDVNHVFQVQNAQPNDLTGMVIIQLEYDASFLVTNLGKQSITLYGGWFPLSINHEKNQFEFAEDLIVGPGKSMNGKILVDLSDHLYPITVTGVLKFGQKDFSMTNSVLHVSPDLKIQNPNQQIVQHPNQQIQSQQNGITVSNLHNSDQEHSAQQIPNQQIQNSLILNPQNHLHPDELHPTQQFPENPNLNHPEQSPTQLHPNHQPDQQNNTQENHNSNDHPRERGQSNQAQNVKQNQQNQVDHETQKIKQLDAIMKQNQNERQTNQYQSAGEQDKSLDDFQHREQKYQDLLKDMQSKHDRELQKTVNQYDELKKMMLDLSSTQQQFMGRGGAQIINNASLAMLNEGKLYDQSDLEKWRIIESMTSVPRKTFYQSDQKAFVVEAQFGGKNLSRGEMAFLTQNGVKGLLQSDGKDSMVVQNDDLETKSMEIELLDNKTTSMIIIQFLSFRPKQALISQYVDADYSPQSIYSQEAAVPQRVHFIINFFDFPLFTTDPIIFENGSDKRQFQEALRNDQPLIFMREAFLKNGKDYKEPVYKFEVEAATAKFPNIHKWFCNYMYHKCVTIEIWDCDSLQMFGTAKIPLRQLLRQQQNSCSMMRSVDIVSSDFKKIMGQLQIMIKNIGRQPQVQESKTGELFISNKFGTSHSKRKVISNCPLNLNARSLLVNKNPSDGAEVSNQSLQSDDRIKERIRRCKINNIANTEDKDAYINQGQLDEINRFKEMKKQAFVKSVIQEHISDEKVIHAQFGEAEIISFQFKSEFKLGQTFQFIIDDPDYQYNNIIEIGLIHQPEEWKFFVDRDNYPKPNEYTLLQMKNPPHTFTFHLKGQESVTFLLKLLIYRDVDLSYDSIQKTEDVVQQRGRDYLRSNCYPRSIAVYINTNDNGQSVGGLKLRVFPHNNVVDHIYRFNERDNQKVKLTFPALYSYTLPSHDQRPLLYSTDKDVGVEWADDFQIRISLRMPQVRKQNDFNILAYGDSYFKKLIANWQVQVSSLSGFGLEIPMGQVQQSKLTVNCDIARQVRLYSSHPLTVWFTTPFDKIINLTPGKINILNINIRQFSEQIQRILVNCVDNNSKDIVTSWIINLAPTIPAISQVYVVQCPMDQPKIFEFQYQNKTNQDTTLMFVSSHPNLLQIMESKYLIRAQGMIDISVRILRKGDLQDAEIKLFISDEDKTKDTCDCLLFRVTYVIAF